MSLSRVEANPSSHTRTSTTYYHGEFTRAQYTDWMVACWRPWRPSVFSSVSMHMFWTTTVEFLLVGLGRCVTFFTSGRLFQPLFTITGPFFLFVYFLQHHPYNMPIAWEDTGHQAPIFNPYGQESREGILL